MIRDFEARDAIDIHRIHAQSGLPSNCFPNVNDELFFIKEVVELDRKVALAGFLKTTAEAYILVDHNAGTPDWRWGMLQQLAAHGFSRAAAMGLDQCSCWIPPEASWFSKRVEALGAVRSPWPSYTFNLRGPHG